TNGLDATPKVNFAKSFSLTAPDIPARLCDALLGVFRSKDISINTPSPKCRNSSALRPSRGNGLFALQPLPNLGMGRLPFQGKGMLGCFRRGPELGGSPPPCCTIASWPLNAIR